MDLLGLDKAKAQIAQANREILVNCGNAAQNYFAKAFRNQGWDGTPWKESLRRKKKPATNWSEKPTLVQRGTLRRAVSNMMKTHQINGTSIKMIVDLPYAAIQNSGGIINKKARTQVNHFTFAENGSMRFSKKKNATHAQKNTIGAHDVNIPQRQFVGQTKELTEKQQKIIKTTIDRIFKK
jgi:phage gpG-like protein